MAKQKAQEFDVRVILVNGVFKFDDRCYMHRHAKRGTYIEHVDASARSRRQFTRQLKAGHLA